MAQIMAERSTKRNKAKMQIRSTSRQILDDRRLRIYRGVEQPGSSSVNTHIAKNQLVLTLVQQLYSRNPSQKYILEVPISWLS
jgi:hypothetical protein